MYIIHLYTRVHHICIVCTYYNDVLYLITILSSDHIEIIQKNLFQKFIYLAAANLEIMMELIVLLKEL